MHVVYVEEYSLSLVSAYGSFAYTDAETIQSLAEHAEREARKLLDEQVDNIEAAGGTVNKSYLKLGRPDREIVGLGEEIGAGLIVMGSRGLGGMRKVLMGSVSDSVARRAHCSVLVVREEQQ